MNSFLQLSSIGRFDSRLSTSANPSNEVSRSSSRLHSGACIVSDQSCNFDLSFSTGAVASSSLQLPSVGRIDSRLSTSGNPSNEVSRSSPRLHSGARIDSDPSSNLSISFTSGALVSSSLQFPSVGRIDSRLSTSANPSNEGFRSSPRLQSGARIESDQSGNLSICFTSGAVASSSLQLLGVGRIDSRPSTFANPSNEVSRSSPCLNSGACIDSSQSDNLYISFTSGAVASSSLQFLGVGRIDSRLSTSANPSNEDSRSSPRLHSGARIDSDQSDNLTICFTSEAVASSSLQFPSVGRIGSRLSTSAIPSNEIFRSSPVLHADARIDSDPSSNLNACFTLISSIRHPCLQ